MLILWPLMSSLILTKLFLHEILLLIFKISDQAVFFDILILDIWQSYGFY